MSNTQQQRQRYPPARRLEIQEVKNDFEAWRAFLVKATTVVNHGGPESWTGGVPIAATKATEHLQANWENIRRSLVQNVAELQNDKNWTIAFKRHKADEFHLGATTFDSQTCRSWRTEAQILNEDNEVVLAAYWGMGLHRQSKYIYGLVLRVHSVKALDAALKFIDNVASDT